MMKLSFLLLAFSLSVFGQDQVLEVQKQSVVIETTTVDRPTNIDISGANVICLGSGWENINEKIALRIERISGDHPGLFFDLADGKENCLDVAKVPQKAFRNLDEVLNLIDKSASENMVAALDKDGSLIKDGANNKVAFDTTIDPNDLPLKYENSSLPIKMLRAEAIIFPAQAATMGIFAALPSSISNWDAAKWKVLDKNFVRAWTSAPVMDKDAWYVNGVMHPITGSFYYSTLRAQGATRMQSFLFAILQSTIWEYAIESIVEQPSIQDLILTPVVGAIMGELTYMATRQLRKGGFTTLEKVVVTVINPAYVILNGYK